MLTASALARDCGYPRELRRTFPPSAALKKGADQGTLFHEAVKTWSATRKLPIVEEDEEVNGWLQVLSCIWWPQRNAFCEYPIGLSTGGRHLAIRQVPTPEGAPHQYVSLDPSKELLCASTVDYAWLEPYEAPPQMYIGEPEELLPAGTPIVVVRDWKTGKWPATEAARNLQLGVGGFAMASLLGVQAMRLEIYYVRDGYCDSALIKLDSTDAMSDAARLWNDINEAARLDDAPRPGPHCEPCWERKKGRCQVGMREIFDGVSP